MLVGAGQDLVEQAVGATQLQEVFGSPLTIANYQAAAPELPTRMAKILSVRIDDFRATLKVMGKS